MMSGRKLQKHNFIKAAAFLIFLIPAFSSAQSVSPMAAVSKEDSAFNVSYTVRLNKNIRQNDLETQWWYQYLDKKTNEKFFSGLIQRADSGKIIIMLPEWPYDKIATASDLKEIFHPNDTLMVEPDYIEKFEPIMQLVERPFVSDDISSLTFNEVWKFDPANFSFEKNVVGFTVNCRKTGPDWEYLGELPKFYVPIAVLTPSSLVLEDRVYVGEKSGAIIFDPDLVQNKFGPDAIALRNEVNYNSFVELLKKTAMAHPELLRDPVYPYTGIPDPGKQAEILKNLGSCNTIRFREEWLLNFSDPGFGKRIDGVCFCIQQKGKDGTAPSIKQVAFLPLNGFVPSPLIGKGPLLISKFNYNSSLHRLNDYFPDMQPRHIDSILYRSFGYDLLQKVNEHKLNCYPRNNDVYEDDPWKTDRAPKEWQQVDSVYKWKDVRMELNYENFETLDSVWFYRELDYATLDAYKFYESWSFDPVRKKMTKNVLSIGMIMGAPTYKDEHRPKLIFNVDLKKNSQKIMELPEFMIGKNVISMIPIRKFYLIDDGASACIEYVENHDRCISPVERYPLISRLIDMALKGELTAYDPNNADKVFDKVLLASKLKAFKDSLHLRSEIDLNYLLVDKIEFNENWYYDMNATMFHKKINAMTFIHEWMKTENSITVPMEERLFTIRFQ